MEMAIVDGMRCEITQSTSLITVHHSAGDDCASGRIY